MSAKAPEVTELLRAEARRNPGKWVYVIDPTFFGEDLSLNSDRESILANLRMIDEWCRLRLPDKFLERYEAALAAKTH